MNRVVRLLKEMRVTEEQTFIKNSLIKRASLLTTEVPNTDSDLEKIVELNEAISVLENHLGQKPCRVD